MVKNKSVKILKPAKTFCNPLFVAREYAEIIKSGRAKSQADLARMLGVTRSRVNQFMRLLRLDETTLQYFEGLGDVISSKNTTERKLRNLVISKLKK